MLKLVANTHDHSQCKHTTVIDKLFIVVPSVTSLVMTMMSLCLHMNSGANWKTHEAEPICTGTFIMFYMYSMDSRRS